MSQIPKFYRKALKKKIIDEFGTQAEFCRRHNFERKKINDILKGRRNLTFDSMEAFSKAFGISTYEMLSIGKELSEKKKPVADTTNIINLFRHKTLALELNKQLLEIEKLEPGRMREFNAILDTLLKSIKDRKEPYQPGKTDRRSGQDRRQASGG